MTLLGSASGRMTMTLALFFFKQRSRPAIKNDSSEVILSRLHSSIHALGDEIQDSYQRRE